MDLHNLNAEQCVIGACLLDTQGSIRAEILSEVRPAHMWRGAHATTLDAIARLHSDGKPLDAMTVDDALIAQGVNEPTLLADCMRAVPTAAHGLTYARTVAALARRRTLADTGRGLVARAEDLTADIDAAVADTSDALSSSAAGHVAALDRAQLVEGALEALEREGEPLGWAPPWKSLARVWRLVPGWVHVVIGFRSCGKALALDTPIPTPSGWTTMGDLKPGDGVFDENGRPCRVIAATAPMFDRPCYEVEFSDGTTIVADGSHHWFTYTAAARRSEVRASKRGPTRLRGTDQRHLRAMPSVVTTEQIAATLRTSDHANNHAVKVARPLDLPDADLPIDAYVLGVWLGDGASTSARITYAESDREIVGHIAACGVTVREHPPRRSATSRTATLGVRDKSMCARGHRVDRTGPPASRGQRCPMCDRLAAQARTAGVPVRPAPNPTLQSELRRAGVLGNKHIPHAYLRASIRQREALLQGLMDTDGWAGPAGNCEFTSMNRRLADGALELIRSLGYRATLRVSRATLDGRDVGEKYRIIFTPDRPVFRMARKLARQKLKRHLKAGYRYIADVRPVESVAVRCVQVDSPSALFLCSDALIATHNSALLDAMLVGLAESDDLRTLIWSPEGAPTQEHLARLGRIRANAIGPWAPSSAVRDLTWCAERVSWLDHERHPTLSSILAAADAHRARNRMDVVVIDPFTSVQKFDGPADEAWDRALNRHLSRMQSWARSREVALVVVAHPKQCERVQAKALDGGKAMIRPVATDAHIHGGMMWGNQTDSLISVWRDETGATRSPAWVDVHVQKIRHEGRGGQMGRKVTLRREPSGQYTQMLQEAI